MTAAIVLTTVVLWLVYHGLVDYVLYAMTLALILFCIAMAVV